MSRIGQTAPYLDGIPVVASSTERDALFPAPDTRQRVQNLATGYIERYTGTTWSQEVAVGNAGPVVNVRAFGAVLDDTTDDTLAIQAALTAAGAVSGTVLIDGPAKVSATANTVPGASGSYALLIPSGVKFLASSAAAHVRCVSDGATIIAVAGASSASHATDVVVSVDIIGGDSTNNGIGRGVYFFRADRCTLRDCTLSGMRLGVQIDRSSSDSAYNRGCRISRVTVRDTFGTTGGNGSGFFASGVDGLTLNDIQAIDVAEHGLYIAQDSRNVSLNGAVLQPKVTTNLNCGVQVFTSTAVPNISHISLTGVIVRNAKWGILFSASGGGKITQISITGGSASGCVTAGVFLSNVQGATINGVPADGTTAGSGIEADNSRSVSLNGCCSTGNFGYGALFVTSPNCSVTGGDYVDNDTGINGNAGIRFATASTGGKVTGARCTDDQGVKTQSWGIQVDTTSSNATLTDTDVSGNLTGSIQLNSATGCDVRNCRGYNPGGPSAITVTASPFSYTAGSTPENVAIMGGTVSGVTKNGTTIATTTNQQIRMAPQQTIIVTYTVAPTMAKDIQ